MQGIEKWNYKTRKYDAYEAPDGVMLYSDDMSAECSCAQCGKKIRFGDGYVSLEIHNPLGFGYCVCVDCMRKEIDRVNESEREAVNEGQRKFDGAVALSSDIER